MTYKVEFRPSGGGWGLLILTWHYNEKALVLKPLCEGSPNWMQPGHPGWLWRLPPWPKSHRWSIKPARTNNQNHHDQERKLRSPSNTSPVLRKCEEVPCLVVAVPNANLATRTESIQQLWCGQSAPRPMQSSDISAKLSSKSHGTSPLALGAAKLPELFCSSFPVQCDFCSPISTH